MFFFKDELVVFHVGFVVLLLFKKRAVQLAYFIHLKTSVVCF